MAFALAVIGVVVGIVLGLRYKVLILVPAVMVATILAIIIGVVRADSLWSIVLTAVAAVTAVQFGYLAGIVVHAAITSVRPPRREGSKPDSEIGLWLAAYLAIGRLADSGLYCEPSPASASASLVRQSACLRIRASSDSDKSTAAITNSANAIGRVKKIVQ